MENKPTKAEPAKPQGIKRMLKKATNLFTRKPDETTTLYPVSRETGNRNRSSMAADKKDMSHSATQRGGDRAWPLSTQQENLPFFSTMPANNNPPVSLYGGLGQPASIMPHTTPLQVQRLVAALNVEDYVKEREILAASLANKLKNMASKKDIGAFMVENYYRRDTMLGGIVTRMADDKVPLVNIGAAVLDALFNPPTPRSPAFTLPGEQYNHGVLGGIENYPPPFSQLAPLPAAAPAPAPAATANSTSNNGPSTEPPIRRPVHVRGHNLETFAPNPRYAAPPAIMRFTTPIISRTDQELNDKDECLAREEAEEDSDDDVPILLPASMDRIDRGYYDPRLDG